MSKSLTDWFTRAARHIDPTDFLRLNPLEAVRTLWRFQKDRRGERLPEDDPGVRDPEFVGVLLDICRALGTYYLRYQVRGIDNVPAEGPALLVGSHNGGIVTLDSLLTLVAVWDRFGPARAVHPLAHDILFSNELTRKYARRLGVLRAGHEGARRAFALGQMALVYPGSEIDSFRPFSQRGRIELAGRKGFLRLALRSGVPIIPVVSAGTHEQFVVLSRGDALVELLGLKRHLRIAAFPLVLALPWGLTSGYFPYLPLPAQTTVAFGPALRWPHLRPEHADDEAVLERCYQEVVGAMQVQLDELMVDRVPILGKR